MDRKGGAAKAAYRFHTGLCDHGVDSTLFSQFKTKGGRKVSSFTSFKDVYSAKFRAQYDRWGINSNIQFSPAKIGVDVHKIIPADTDIVFLHWVNSGYLSISDIARIQQPIIWTMHDMWPFTGGCHYDQECGRYVNGCGKCPLLGSDSSQDLSAKIWKKKRALWRNQDITFISPSVWLADCAKNSPITEGKQVKVIKNGVDLDLFFPHPKPFARKVFNLPQDKKLILFSAMSAKTDPRKGFTYLQQTLQNLGDSFKSEVELVILGAYEAQEQFEGVFKCHYPGYLQDDYSLSLIYSAVDVHIAPSLQDNLPNTVVEANACGIPSIAFEIGGFPDLIHHLENGYLAKPFDVQDLSHGLATLLSMDRHEAERVSQYARKLAKREFNLQTQSSKYLELFTQVLSTEAMVAQ